MNKIKDSYIETKLQPVLITELIDINVIVVDLDLEKINNDKD